MATTKKATKPVVAEQVKETKAKKRVLAINLGNSLKKGDEISEEVLADLLDAGFTEERLFKGD